MTSCINDHSRIDITGVIEEEALTFIHQKVETLDPIIVKFKNQEKEQAIFNGLIKNLTIEIIDEVTYLSLQGISYSYLLDIEKKSRSFQQSSMTYKTLVEEILKQYDKGSYKCADAVLESSTIKMPLIQYEESDWAFLKRIFSVFGKGLLSPIEMNGLKLWIGAENEKVAGPIDDSLIHKRQIKDYDAQKILLNNPLIRSELIDYFSIEVTSYMPQFIGTKVKCDSKTFYVESLQMHYKQNEFLFTYLLAPRQGLYVAKIPPSHLKGISLIGRVIAVDDRYIKVHFNIDKAQNVENAFWYPFATTASSSTGGGWYFMPEIGDDVRVYFEDGSAKSGVATEVVSRGNSKSNPSVQLIRTIHGKEIRLTGNGIYITSKSGDLFIQLDDKEGIGIYSDTNIQLSSTDSIEMYSDTAIDMTAETIQFTTGASGDTTLTLSDDASINANQVKINGQ